MKEFLKDTLIATMLVSLMKSAEGGYLIEGLDSTDLLDKLELYVKTYKVQEKN